MEAELVNVTGHDSRPVPGLATLEHGNATLDEREESCYTDKFGMYHTNTGPTVASVPDTPPFCDSHESEVPAERSIFTLNSAVMAVGEGKTTAGWVRTSSNPTCTVSRTAEVSSVTLVGKPVDDYMVRKTNRGKEVLVKAPPSGEHTLVVETTP